MKKIITLSLAASAMTLSLNAAETNSELVNKIDSLQKQLNELKASQSKMQDKIEDRIDGVETKAMVDKIDFGLEFRTRADNFEAKTANGNKSSAKNIWSNRLRLNMGSEITDDMKFTGRLSMYKNWADSATAYLYSSMDPMQGRRPSDSGIFVERAYIDWSAIKGSVPVTLTVGRQPSSDGPSHQFKDNTTRKATYSALSFDGAADGVVATVDLQKVSGVDGMALRVGYGKGYQDNTTYSYIGSAGAIKDSNVLGAFFDSGLGVDGSLLQLSVVSATDMVSNTTNSLGSNTNTNIGDMMLYTAMVEFTNIKNSNFDLFAHYAISEAKPNGVTSNQATPFGDYPMGLLTNTPNDQEQKDGHAFWVGTRYTVPMESLKNPKIGFEYNKGSKNWFSFTQGSNSLTNKLATRGNAYEVYYIQPINRYAHLRLGAEMITYDYTGTGYQIGAPMMISGNDIEKLSNYYFLLNINY